ncbi:MAG: YdcF family protein [Lachnospiraceae bacterium]|nr:YdcF family protein [Lachnospiraceae bacterium]
MISIFLFFLSVFCIIYYGIIIGYSGLQTSFSHFWPVAAMMSAFFAVFLQSSFYLNLPGIVSFILKLLTAGVILFFLILFLRILTCRSNSCVETDYLIVLGANVRDEAPSRALKERIDMAYEYLKTHEKTTAILTGYQNPQASISQGKCMQNELRKMGIPAYRLLVESDARTTLENFQFSKDYMTRLEPTTAVVTSDFHLYRAKKIAAACGYKNIKGIGAKTPTPLLLHCYIRELFAVTKYLFRG